MGPFYEYLHSTLGGEPITSRVPPGVKEGSALVLDHFARLQLFDRLDDLKGKSHPRHFLECAIMMVVIHMLAIHHVNPGPGKGEES